MAGYCSVKTNGEKHIEDVLRSKLTDVTEIQVNDISGMIILTIVLFISNIISFFYALLCYIFQRISSYYLILMQQLQFIGPILFY